MSRSSDIAETTVTASKSLPVDPPPSNVPDDELGIGRRIVTLARQVVMLSFALKKPAVLGIKIFGNPSLSTTTSGDPDTEKIIFVGISTLSHVP
jgi:hypothetical protein